MGLSDKEIQKKIKNVKVRIAGWQYELNLIQDNCSHNDLKKTHGANTGNYDPSCDRYWTDFHCSVCDKQWREEGSK